MATSTGPAARVDLALPARDLSVPRALEMAVEADRSGWGGVWLSEVLDVDALVMAGAIAAVTTRIRIGTAIVPISTRSAATLAMAASTLARLAPGRVHLGLGTSTPQLVEDRHDRPVHRPLAESRGTVEVVRAALAGQRVDHKADPAVRGLRIVPPSEPPPVLLAALGPRMTALAIEVADGLVLNLAVPDDAVARAAAARQSRGDAFETVMLLRTVVDPTDDELMALRRELAGYVRVPVYGAALARLGGDLGPVTGAPDLDAAADAMPAALVAALSCTGSAEDCAVQLTALARAGVTPLVVPAAGATAADRTIGALTAVLRGQGR